ncbi:MAG: hypothetical protein ACO3S5_09010, partial [Ilumatobacteraceae bacterium]
MIRRVTGAVLAVALLAACTPRRPDATDDTVDSLPATTVDDGAFYEATIRRTTDGVPHVLAADLK